MTTDIFPAGVNSQGNNTWIITPTSPVNTAGTGITLATLTGSTAVDLTCYLGAEDQEIGFDQDREDDTRACDENKREEFGRPTFSKESILHIVDPQGDPTDPGNRAVGALPPSSVVYATLIMAVKHGTALVAANNADVYAVTTGEEHITPRASGKYRREIKTSFTRVAHGVPITGA